MPLDTRIALSTQTPQLRSPLSTLGAIAQFRQQQGLNEQRQLASEQRRRDMERDDRIRETVRRTGSPHAAITELYKDDPEAAGLLSKSLFEHIKAENDAEEQQVVTSKKQFDFAANILKAPGDQGGWDSAYRAVEAFMPPELMAHIPREYSPETQKQIVDYGTSISDKLKLKQDAIENDRLAQKLILEQQDGADKHIEALQKAEAYQRQAASQLLSTADNQEQLDAYQRILVGRRGYPAKLVAEFGNQWTPEYGAKARAMGMDPKEQDASKHQKVTEWQGQQNINLRGAELQRRKDEDAAGTGTMPGGRGRALTPNRQSEIAQQTEKQYADLEKDLRERFTDPTSGKFSIPEDAYEEVGHRKLQIEDSGRKMQGLPPILEAEYDLAGRQGTDKDLRKIRNVYKKLTGRETPLEQMQKLTAELAKTKDPKQAADLRTKLGTLRKQYSELVGR